MDIRLGRLRQWAGEVISSREKTNVNEEFTALEKDIELRKEGINKLITASEAYHHALSKKKPSAALKDDEKLLPIDVLGIVMIQHGGQFGQDSTFGNALVRLGNAHSKIATLQEAYALTFKDTFFASLERFRDEIKEYELLRKKLDGQSSAVDSATTKLEKLQNSKKEKDRTEVEDEVERAKQRYEETVEDLRAYIHAIQENECAQLYELTSLVDVEFNFVQTYLNVLKELKDDWEDCISKHPDTQKRTLGLRSVLYPKASKSRDSGDSADSSECGDGPEASRPTFHHGRSNSNASNKSQKASSRPASRLSRKRTHSGAASIAGSGNGEAKGSIKDKDKSRRLSVAGWASNAMESVTGGKGKKNISDRDSFAALDDSEANSRLGETSGTSGHSRSSSSFRSIARLASKATTPNSKEGSPSTSGAVPSYISGSYTPGKISKPQSLREKKKIVRALYDFTGSSDELSFKTGMEIIVLNEVLDDWWMGEVDGQTGLFPTSHTEVIGTIASSSGSSLSSLPPQSRSSNSRRISLTGRQLNTPTPKHRPATLPPERDKETDRYIMSDGDDEDARDLSGIRPMSINAASSVYYGGFDNNSENFTTDGTESLESLDAGQREEEVKTLFPSGGPTGKTGDDWITFHDSYAHSDRQAQLGMQGRGQKLVPTLSQRPITPKQRTMSLLGSLGPSLKVPMLDSAQQPLISRSKSEDPSLPLAVNTINVESGSSNQSSPMKRAPPPPPPPPLRRPSQTPPILPPRKVPSPSLASNSLLLGPTPNPPSKNGSVLNENSTDVGNDRSPFDSVVELGLEESGRTEGGCDRFRQNPFKPKGMCSNCLQFHASLIA